MKEHAVGRAERSDAQHAEAIRRQYRINVPRIKVPELRCPGTFFELRCRGRYELRCLRYKVPEPICLNC